MARTLVAFVGVPLKSDSSQEDTLIYFGQPENLMVLWLLLPLVGVMWWALVLKRRRSQRFAAQRYDELVTHPFRRGRYVFHCALIVLSISLIIVSLARPRWGYEWKDVPRGGVDLMVVIDLSRSMLAQDISPTRLERAKRKILDLLAVLKGDRIGIVGFAGAAFVQCPLTVDYDMARLFVNYLHPDLISIQGTNFYEGIETAKKSLIEGSAGDSQGKAIILITDGEDHSGRAMEAANSAVEKGIKIFSVGVGAESGAPIPLEGGGFKKDQAGNLILAKYDESLLQQLSHTTGGFFVRSVSGDFDLEEIYFRGIREGLPQSEGGVSRQKLWHERYQWFLGLGFFVLMIQMIFFSNGHVSRKVSVLLILLAVQARESSAQREVDGEQSFRKENYQQAVKDFLDAEIEQPDDPRHVYNRGVSAYRAGDYDQAIQSFQRSSESTDQSLAAKSTFNLGNSYGMKNDFASAVQAYQKALELNPKDQRAAENLSWAQQQLAQQNQQKKQGEKGDKSESSQENSDQSSGSEQSPGEPSNEGQRADGNKQEDSPQQSESQDNQTASQQEEPKDGDQSQSRQGIESGEDQAEAQKNDQASNNQQEEAKPSELSHGGGEEGGDNQQEQGAASKTKASPDPSSEMTQDQVERLLRRLGGESGFLSVPPRLQQPSENIEKDW